MSQQLREHAKLKVEPPLCILAAHGRGANSRSWQATAKHLGRRWNEATRRAVYLFASSLVFYPIEESYIIFRRKTLCTILRYFICGETFDLIVWCNDFWSSKRQMRITNTVFIDEYFYNKTLQRCKRYRLLSLIYWYLVYILFADQLIIDTKIYNNFWASENSLRFVEIRRELYY